LQAETTVEALYALDEPWRGRFLHLVAALATGRWWDDRTPEPGELEGWLEESWILCRYVALLLEHWTGGSARLRADGLEVNR
jgi:hypothetical protein